MITVVSCLGGDNVKGEFISTTKPLELAIHSVIGTHFNEDDLCICPGKDTLGLINNLLGVIGDGEGKCEIGISLKHLADRYGFAGEGEVTQTKGPTAAIMHLNGLARLGTVHGHGDGICLVGPYNWLTFCQQT